MSQNSSTVLNLTVAPDLDLAAFLGVTTAFINAYNAFNKQEVPTLGGLLADDAVMYKCRSGTAISGKAAIVQYLQVKLPADQPICALVTIALHPPRLPTSVRGVAIWSYSGWATPTTFSVQYEFLFQPHAPYLITSMWARPD